MAKPSSPRYALRSSKQNEAREKLLELYKNTPIPDADIVDNFGLYTRSVMAAKFLYLNEIYQQILDIPGIVIEFGVCYGSTLALLSSLRNVCEPHSFTRKVVGFDTFEGYRSFSPEDGNSSFVTEYAETGGEGVVGKDYENHLREVLDSQEQDNIASHIKKYELVKGNVIQTVEQYLTDNPETIISLAIFDLALYEPTKKCLETISLRLV